MQVHMDTVYVYQAELAVRLCCSRDSFKSEIFADTLSRELFENRANSKHLGARAHQAEE